VLVHNPEYRGRFTGNAERVELSVVPEWPARLAMYEAGNLDTLLLSPAPPPERDRIRQRHAGECISGPRLATYFVRLDVTQPPFHDVRVRKAFAFAVDEERLAGVVCRGLVFPGTGGFVPSGMPGHSPGIGLPYAPAQARQLLDEAGYPGGRGFPVVEALTLRSNATESQFLATQWRDNLGIEITWRIVESAESLERLATQPPHILLDGWLADYPDPDNFLRVGRQYCQADWRSETYDKLVEEARRATDQTERMKLYQQADRILIEETAIIPISYLRFHLLVKPWVTRFPTSAVKVWFLRDVVIEPH